MKNVNEYNHNLLNFILNFYSGTGWLTINVIAVLSDFDDHLYDLYVKLIVSYPESIKQYTTKTIEKSSGWTPIGEMFRFDQAPKDTPFQLQIWDYNTFKSDELLYQENTTLFATIDSIIFKNSSIKTSFKLFMVSIWRDDFEYEVFDE